MQREIDPEGRFQRQMDAFRNWATFDGSSGFRAEAGRYHLYISWACPWAHRVVLARELLGLRACVTMSAVDPIRDARGWAFRPGRGHGPDPINGFAYLSEAYHATLRDFTGRCTVPVLWDSISRKIVNNSDDDILRMFNQEFRRYGHERLDLYPEAHRGEIDRLDHWIHETLNDGVYRAGFATTQSAYNEAVQGVFETLGALEERLAGQRFLMGDHLTEADLKLFPTLVRFDAVYHGHFKCNLRRLVDFPNLWAYTRDIHQWPGIAPTVDMDHIKRHYYGTHPGINPTRIVPQGPLIDFGAPHDRERLSRTPA